MGGRGEAQRRHERNESGLQAQQAHSPRHRLGNENGRTIAPSGQKPLYDDAYALSGRMKSHWIQNHRAMPWAKCNLAPSGRKSAL